MIYNFHWQPYLWYNAVLHNPRSYGYGCFDDCRLSTKTSIPNLYIFRFLTEEAVLLVRKAQTTFLEELYVYRFKDTMFHNALIDVSNQIQRIFQRLLSINKYECTDKYIVY